MSFGTRGRVDHAISGSAMSRRPHFIRCYVTAMVQHMSTTSSHATRIPSTRGTRWSSPSGTGIGQASQNSAVLRLKDRPPPGITVCESFERSHPRNSSGLAAVSSYLSVVEAPQAVHLQRWDPDEVLPLRLSDRRSRGDTRPSWVPLPKGYLTVPEKVIYRRERWATGRTFCPSG